MIALPTTASINVAVAQAERRIMVRSATDYAQRADGWQSSLLGIGTVEDKIQSLRYDGFVNRLTDPILEGMFMTEIFAYNGVTIFPDVAFSEGIKYDGLSDRDAACAYLDEHFRVPEISNDGSVWGRLYGACATWFVTDRELDELTAPLDPGEEILALRNIERPFVTPILDPDTFDPAGRPQFYMLTPPQGRIHTTVHISRIVLWPGDRTPQRRRIQIGHWDFSVLQRPFDVLKRNGMVSTSAMQLLAEASLGILSIKDLWASVASNNQATIAQRMRLFNQARANSRAILLDKEREEFTRVATTFAGVADIQDRARLEVCAAFRVPEPRMMGQAPSGLNGSAGADSNERTFQKDVGAYQRHSLEAPVYKLVKTLLDANQSPVSSDGLKIGWPDLWAPTEAERADMYSKVATADGVYLANEVLSPANARERFKPEGFQIELPVRATTDENGDGDVDLNDEPGTGDPADLLGKSEGGNTPDAPGLGPQKDPGAPEAQLNGAEIEALAAIVSDVAAGKIPRDAGVQIIALSYHVTPEQADAIVGSAGKGFTTAAPLPAPGIVPAPKPNAPAPDTKTDGVDEPQSFAPLGPITHQNHPRNVETIMGVVQDVAHKRVPRESGLHLLAMAYGMNPDDAEKLLASAGKDFEPPAPPPAAQPPSKNVPPAAQKPNEAKPLTGE